MAHEKIMIVEDEAVVAMELEARLHKLGYIVAGVVSRGEDAIAGAERSVPDLVLMDIMLEGELDGIRTAEVLSEKFGIPVIFLTAFSDERTLERAMKAGPYGYLVKPFEETDLRTTLELALHKCLFDRLLRESEQRYRTLFELAGDSICIIAAEGEDAGRIVDANEAAARMHGYTREELLRLKISDLATTEHAGKAPELMERIRRGELVKAEVSHRRKDGTIFPIEISAGLFEVAGKKYVLGFDRDITGRKRAEQERERSAALQSAINTILRISLGGEELPVLLSKALDAILTVRVLSFQQKGAIFLSRSDNHTLVMTAQKNMPDALLRACGTVPFGKCFCGRAAVSRELRFGSSNHPDHENNYADGEPHGHYCVPILQRESVLGLLNVYVQPESERTAFETEFLRAAADTLAGVIVRKQAEQDLRQNRDRLSEAQRVARIGSWERDLATNRLFWSDELFHIFGLNKENGAPAFAEFVSLIHPEDRERLTHVVNEALRTGAPYEIDYRVQRKDGYVPTVRVRGEVARDAAGTPLFLRGTTQDVTERVTSEMERERLIGELQTAVAAISRSKKIWQETFDSITDMMSIHDANFIITKVNRAFARHFNMTPEQLIGKHCYELFHHTSEAIIRCPHKRSLISNREETEEYADKPSGRTFRVSTFPYTFPDSDARGTIHIVRDITEERETELRLIMNERLASLGQMAAGIAHEINNPLAAIAGCAEGLLNRVRQGRIDAAFFERYLLIIDEEIHRCKTITTGMLSFVRKPGSGMTDVDVHATLDKAIAMVGFQGRLNNVLVEKQYAGCVPVTTGNEGELRQAFVAFITNALDAMGDRGKLAIRTVVDNEKINVQFIDTGAGISPELMDKIFDPFFTTKSGNGGTGLGLSIARKILSNHKGTIRVDSRQGSGTTVTVTLPAFRIDSLPEA